MFERVCFDLRKVLRYDDEVKIFVAFIKGNEMRRIMYADGKMIEIMCAPGTDVLLVISCKTAQICYVEPLTFTNDRISDIVPAFNHWGIEYSIEREEVSARLNDNEYGIFYLYDRGFRVIFDSEVYTDESISA